MCQSMVNIQSPAAEIRRGKKKKKEEGRRKKKNKPQHENIMVSLLHRATITMSHEYIVDKIVTNFLILNTCRLRPLPGKHVVQVLMSCAVTATRHPPTTQTLTSFR